MCFKLQGGNEQRKEQRECLREVEDHTCPGATIAQCHQGEGNGYT